MAGDPILARAAAEEGRDLADAIGDGWTRASAVSPWIAQLFQGDPAGAAAQFGELAAEAEAAHDVVRRVASLAYHGVALAWQGDTGAARAAADAAVEAASDVGEIHAGAAHSALASAALAAGDVATAQEASEADRLRLSLVPQTAALWHSYSAQAALAGGDLMAARRSADKAVTTMTGWYSIGSLTTRCRVAMAQGEPDQAERDAHDALTIAAGMQAYLGVPDTLECLAVLAGDAGSHPEAARLFGAAEATRQRMGTVRFKVWDAGCEPRWRRCVMPWARRLLTLHGPRAPPYLPRRRSPTRSAVGVNANDPPAAGPHSPRPSLTWYDWSAKGWPTTTSRRGCSSHPAPYKRTSPTSTPSSA